MLALAVLLAGLGAGVACTKATSDNIQVWKTTQKGPERLHEALADPGVTPRLRAEAAAALVDIGHADEVETVMAQIPAGERAEILKTLIPTDEVAMKDPAPEKSLAARDALFSVRAYASVEEQKQIDSALLPAIASDLRTGHLRNGRHSIEKVLSAIGPDSGSMLADVLADPVPVASYPLAAELLGKVGDETARNRGATALIARAKKGQDQGQSDLAVDVEGDRRRGWSGGDQVPPGQGAGRQPRRGGDGGARARPAPRSDDLAVRAEGGRRSEGRQADP